MGDTVEEIARDVSAIGRISAVQPLLRLICQTTGMGFAAVARVTEGTWTACAVHDDIQFGLQPGGQLDVHTTLCKESRQARAPVVIDHASMDATYRNHHTPRTYNIESYISVPIVMRDGEYFGNLCAIDPRPAKVSDPQIVLLFSLFAELVAAQLANERQMDLDQATIFDAHAAGLLREQFVAVLGHDLRTPLQAISASSRLLMNQSGDEAKVLGIAQRITNSARRMSGLIDDVLDFARGRLGGGFGVQLSDVPDFGQALRDVLLEVQLLFPHRVIRTDIDFQGVVRCDRGRLQQLTSNLLSNALNHGYPDKPVRLSATAEGSTVVLTVSNEGEPIDPAHLSKLFEPFWRGDAAGGREGLGLGLYICSQIVKSHGGTLEVISSATDGTTFAVRLPYARV